MSVLCPIHGVFVRKIPNGAIDPTEKILASEVLIDSYDPHVRTHHGTFRPR